MRLRFSDGKQKELIHNFRINNNLSWKDLCTLLDVKYGRIISYLREDSLIDECLYKRLDSNGDYEKYILEKLDKNWGKRKGGLNSVGNTKNIFFPEDSKELAEFYGIMLGDGNSNKSSYYLSRKNKRGTYTLTIVGDSRFDRVYLLDYVKPLIENLFGIKAKFGNFKPKSNFNNSKNAMFLILQGVRAVNFLENKGFKPGNKIKNKLTIPIWIKKNDEFLKACLRGLYDTDGSIYKLTNQNSFQICFTNHNLYLLSDVRDSLLSLGILCSKISKYNLYITKKTELRKFLKLIGFSNVKHFNKVKMWNLLNESPVV